MCTFVRFRSPSRPRSMPGPRATRAQSRLVSGVRDSLNGRRLILGVDRLDYSKGIPDRIQAFGQFLDT